METIDQKLSRCRAEVLLDLNHQETMSVVCNVFETVHQFLIDVEKLYTSHAIDVPDQSDILSIFQYAIQHSKLSLQDFQKQVPA